MNHKSARFFAVERRYNYTTPKTFLELIKLYTNVLARKRNATQESIDRLETGLTKLEKTQAEVDILVDAAKKMAVEVEAKVASADAFAEKVGIEKQKVNEENEAAKVGSSKATQLVLSSVKRMIGPYCVVGRVRLYVSCLLHIS